MFCQNCGAKNNDISVFCENCGAKLEKPVDMAAEQTTQSEQAAVQETAQQNVQPEQAAQQNEQPEQAAQQKVQPEQVAASQAIKEKKPVSKIMIAVIAEAVLLVASLAVFFNIGNKVYSPEKVSEKFFVEVANHNFKEAYKALDVDEDDFINEKNFENASCNQELSKVTEYEVKRTRGTQNGKDVKIQYKTKGSSSSHNYVISVDKKSGKNAVFFENWEVSPESMVVEDFSVSVPAGTEVTVDGVKLDKKYKDKKNKTDEYYQYFTIPAMFAGEHQVVVTQEGMQEVRKIIDTDSDYDFWLDEMNPDEAVLEEILNTATEDFQAVYTAAAEGKDFSEVSKLFSMKEGRQDEVKEAFEEIVDDFTGTTYTTVNKVSFSNLKGSVQEGYIDTDETCMEVCLEFDYKIDYTEDWFGEVSDESYSASDYMYLDFVYEDGKWLLTDFAGAYLYY